MQNEFSIEKTVSDILREDNNLRERKVQTSWHASSIGNCLRGLYIQRLGIIEKELMTDRELRVFNVGNQMEKWLVDLLKAKWMVPIETQVRIEDEGLGISGYADMVIGGDVNKVYEIKTKHSRAFWYMNKEGKPMRQHEYQVWLYLKALGIAEGVIVYLSKDDLAMAEFVVRLDDAIFEKEVVERINLLNHAWDMKNVELLPLPGVKDWQAKYCPVHNYCMVAKLLSKLV